MSASFHAERLLKGDLNNRSFPRLSVFMTSYVTLKNDWIYLAIAIVVWFLQLILFTVKGGFPLKLDRTGSDGI